MLPIQSVDVSELQRMKNGEDAWEAVEGEQMLMEWRSIGVLMYPYSNANCISMYSNQRTICHTNSKITYDTIWSNLSHQYFSH